MKFIFIISLLLTFSIAAKEGEIFENWYFKFFQGETTTKGEFLSPDGTLLDEGRGVMLVEIDNDRGVSKSKTTTKFKNRPGPLVSTATLKRTKENTYSGSAEYSNGVKAKLTLKLLEGKKFKTFVSGPEGVTTLIEGTLTDDGTVTTLERVRASDGSLLLTVRVIYSKRAKERTKPESESEERSQ